MPSSDAGFQDSTIFELLVSFFRWKFRKDPKAALDAMRDSKGEIVFDETGDALIDKWESELAAGLVPDLTEGLPSAEMDKLHKEKEKAKSARKAIKELQYDEKTSRLMNRMPPSSKNINELNTDDLLLGKYK